MKAKIKVLWTKKGETVVKYSLILGMGFFYVTSASLKHLIQ